MIEGGLIVEGVQNKARTAPITCQKFQKLVNIPGTLSADKVQALRHYGNPRCRWNITQA